MVKRTTEKFIEEWCEVCLNDIETIHEHKGLILCSECVKNIKENKLEV